MPRLAETAKCPAPSRSFAVRPPVRTDFTLREIYGQRHHTAETLFFKAPAHTNRRNSCNVGVYLLLANRWALCDNSGGTVVVVARGSMDDAPTIHDQRRFDRIRREVGQD
jgi:hypothetical protein